MDDPGGRTNEFQQVFHWWFCVTRPKFAPLICEEFEAVGLDLIEKYLDPTKFDDRSDDSRVSLAVQLRSGFGESPR